MSYTKGPWWRFGGMVDGYGITSRSEIVIAQDAFNGLHNEANARLIAAAPELLEACKEMCEWLGFVFGSQFAGEPAHKMAMKAIKKAEENKQ